MNASSERIKLVAVLAARRPRAGRARCRSTGAAPRRPAGRGSAGRRPGRGTRPPRGTLPLGDAGRLERAARLVEPGAAGRTTGAGSRHRPAHKGGGLARVPRGRGGSAHRVFERLARRRPRTAAGSRLATSAPFGAAVGQHALERPPRSGPGGLGQPAEDHHRNASDSMPNGARRGVSRSAWVEPPGKRLGEHVAGQPPLGVAQRSRWRMS